MIEFPLGTMTYTNIHDIRFVGTCENLRKALSTLVEDFNAPKFGYNGEDFDEVE